MACRVCTRGSRNAADWSRLALTTPARPGTYTGGPVVSPVGEVILEAEDLGPQGVVLGIEPLAGVLARRRYPVYRDALVGMVRRLEAYERKPAARRCSRRRRRGAEQPG